MASLTPCCGADRVRHGVAIVDRQAGGCFASRWSFTVTPPSLASRIGLRRRRAPSRSASASRRIGRTGGLSRHRRDAIDRHARSPAPPYAAMTGTQKIPWQAPMPARVRRLTSSTRSRPGRNGGDDLLAAGSPRSGRSTWPPDPPRSRSSDQMSRHADPVSLVRLGRDEPTVMLAWRCRHANSGPPAARTAATSSSLASPSDAAAAIPARRPSAITAATLPTPAASPATNSPGTGLRRRSSTQRDQPTQLRRRTRAACPPSSPARDRPAGRRRWR